MEVGDHHIFTFIDLYQVAFGIAQGKSVDGKAFYISYPDALAALALCGEIEDSFICARALYQDMFHLGNAEVIEFVQSFF